MNRGTCGQDLRSQIPQLSTRFGVTGPVAQKFSSSRLRPLPAIRMPDPMVHSPGAALICPLKPTPSLFLSSPLRESLWSGEERPLKPFPHHMPHHGGGKRSGISGNQMGSGLGAGWPQHQQVSPPPAPAVPGRGPGCLATRLPLLPGIAAETLLQELRQAGAGRPSRHHPLPPWKINQQPGLTSPSLCARMSLRA